MQQQVYCKIDIRLLSVTEYICLKEKVVAGTQTYLVDAEYLPEAWLKMQKLQLLLHTLHYLSNSSILCVVLHLLLLYYYRATLILGKGQSFII